MAWTYTKPADSRKDEVRFLIGDTNSDIDEQLLQDDEIEYALTLYPISSDTDTVIDRSKQPLLAALVCAEAILARFQRQADERLPPVNFEYAARAKNYKTLVEDLRLKIAQRGGVVPFVGGTSLSDKERRENDSDRIRPDFYKHEHDNMSINSASQDKMLGIE